MCFVSDHIAVVQLSTAGMNLETAVSGFFTAWDFLSQQNP